MIENLYQFRENFRKQGIYFGFNGPFSQSFIEDIGEMLRKKMQSESVKLSTILNVFSVAIELMQNIVYYSVEYMPEKTLGEHQTEFRFGTLVIGYEHQHYFILSGNMIDNQHIPKLQEKLLALQNMTKDELKKQYKEQRRNKQREEGSKGAGLGFLEMARKASQPLEFVFQPVDECRSYFSIKVVL